MLIGWKYRIGNIRYQVACNDKKSWYARHTEDGQVFSPFKPCPAPLIQNNFISVDGANIRVARLKHEPRDLPSN